MSAAPSSISPTAHYTGHVWVRNGLSHRELASSEGRLLFAALRAPMALSGALGGPTLEAYLLARHRALDKLLEQAIEQYGVTQVVEVACGLSARGWRFSERYGSRLTYIEADLPEMAARKRRSLERMGSLSEHHRVHDLDARRDDGPGSLVSLMARLDPTTGVAIITEGLLGYLDRGTVLTLWGGFARELRAFRTGCYLSDLHLGSSEARAQVQVFRALLSAFVRGRVYLHFADAGEAVGELRRTGFKQATVTRAADVAPRAARGAGAGAGAQLAHVVEALA